MASKRRSFISLIFIINCNKNRVREIILKLFYSLSVKITQLTLRGYSIKFRKQTKIKRTAPRN